MTFLQNNAHDKQRARLTKSGIPVAHVLGTPKAFVKQAATAIGHDQSIADGLWQTDLHEARLLALLVTAPDTISFEHSKQWANDLRSWSLTDQFARYLLPYLPHREALIEYCTNSQPVFTKRLAYAGMACTVLHLADLEDTQIDQYFERITQGAADGRHHVRKAVAWSLVEIGKSSEAYQEQAIILAAELKEASAAEAWVGRHALKELELLVRVPERKRLLSQKSKTGRKATNADIP